MTKRMLIDATHPEETRVVVVEKDQLCDFDFETSTKKQLKGNIYLAKVTRVEPSLQAAFIDYGGNRHGFLAFSEIHPDYYQIPQADREMLEKLELEAARAIAAEDDSAGEENSTDETDDDQPEMEDETVIVGENSPVLGDDAEDDAEASEQVEASAEDGEAAGDAESADAASDDAESGDVASDDAANDDVESDDAEGDDTESDDAEEAARLAVKRRAAAVTEDADEETADVVDAQARMRARLLRSYKIQEVIKRRQILLVQVVKEERGTKGAAMTTYLSLAGRYCVLMPNTPRGGGISRKIANANDRRRLKSITQEMEVPEGMGLIVRTAGQQRSKSEIKRDYDFLLRQWSDIRDSTLESVAPALIYAEGDLIKRAMRDLYSRDLDEVLVEGEAGYRAAKRLMQMMMPSRARNVKQYKDELPLYYRYKVEDQLDAMHSPTVYLPSGGSIVIHTTEALTAIDVNSGRSTRERHIDETAVKTNLEAANEVARQLRLRDLAGLIVIDFIDMGEMRHQRQVERRFREALKIDRARVQVGKISMFGLLELSRQRLRASLQDLSSQCCPTCSGLGVIRSTESCALQILRMIQEEGIRNESESLNLTLPRDVGLYVLNNKREAVVRLEERYDLSVSIAIDDDLTAPNTEVETVKRTSPSEASDVQDDVETVEEKPAKARQDSRQDSRNEPRRQTTEAGQAADEEGEGRTRRKRRRRRRRRGGENSEGAGTEDAVASENSEQPHIADAGPAAETPVADAESTSDAGSAKPVEDEQPAEPRPRRRRRTRRSAKSEKPDAKQAVEAESADASTPETSATEPVSDDGAKEAAPQPESAEPAPEPAALFEISDTPAKAYNPEPEADWDPSADIGAPIAASGPDGDGADAAEPEDSGPARKGWWSRWVR